MKLDALIHVGLDQTPETARQAEAGGFHGLWSLDTGHNPFFPLLLAAEHTRRLTLGTGVAIALARSPMTLAQEAWDLARLSRGRFMLGLGSQVKAHVVRRFSMRWDRPVQQMREMVLALRAIWSSFQSGGELKFQGDYYNLSLMTPFFNPGPNEDAKVPVLLAAVGPHMTEMTGEVADGLMMHPFMNRPYFEGVTLPSLERGLAKAGRHRQDFTVVAPLFIITGDERQQAKLEALVRQQIAFYGSTPAYQGVLEAVGQGALHEELHGLSRAQRWDDMARIIPDEVVEAFAVRAPLDRLAERLLERYGGLYDRLVCHFPLPVADADRLGAIAARLDSAATAQGTPAPQTIGEGSAR